MSIQRRRFLESVAGAGLLFGAAPLRVHAREQVVRASRGTPVPRIKDISVIECQPQGVRLTVVKITTDQDGLYGYGCATFTQRADLVRPAVEKYLKPFLLNKATDRIEDIWQSCYDSSYWKNGPVLNNAISGIDQALWDIKGRQVGMKYGASEATFGSKSGFDIPVDSNELIALTAPRLTFISYGIPEKGDAKWLDQKGSFMFNLVDGLIRLGLFLIFIWGTSLLADIRRVYEYHGAEHKTVFAFENGDPLSTGEVQKYPTFHPRCGTSFLMTVMIISIFVYMLVPVHTFWARFAIRIALLPVITGVSYEIIRFAAKHRKSLFAIMTAPGLWLQRITTRPPTDEQAVCAITALDQAMALEKERGGELVIA